MSGAVSQVNEPASAEPEPADASADAALTQAEALADAVRRAVRREPRSLTPGTIYVMDDNTKEPGK